MIGVGVAGVRAIGLGAILGVITPQEPDAEPDDRSEADHAAANESDHWAAAAPRFLLRLAAWLVIIVIIVVVIIVDPALLRRAFQCRAALGSRFVGTGLLGSVIIIVVVNHRDGRSRTRLGDSGFPISCRGGLGCRSRVVERERRRTSGLRRGDGQLRLARRAANGFAGEAFGHLERRLAPRAGDRNSHEIPRC